MEKYLLIMVGEIPADVCENIAKDLAPIVDSPRLKYQYNKGAILFHFESEVNHFEIHDFVSIICYGIISTYVLTKLNDNLSINIPKHYSDHLFDLENDGENTIDCEQELEMDDEENYSENLALLLDEVKSKIRKPSLDFILDKIKLKGLSSLSQFEKDTLTEYSKN